MWKWSLSTMIRVSQHTITYLTRHPGAEGPSGNLSGFSHSHRASPDTERGRWPRDLARWPGPVSGRAECWEWSHSTWSPSSIFLWPFPILQRCYHLLVDSPCPLLPSICVWSLHRLISCRKILISSIVGLEIRAACAKNIVSANGKNDRLE